MSWGGQNPDNFPKADQPSNLDNVQDKILGDIDQLQHSSSSILPKLESDEDKFYTYNPYEGLNTLLEGRSAQAYRISEAPEFIFEEEKSIKRRSWSENLTFYTGCGALGGAVFGGAIGAYQAYKKGQTQQLKESTRLLANRYINHVTTEGRSMGNGLGVIGLFFAGFESYFYNQWRKLDVPLLPDAMCTVGAGFAAGALYRSAYGMRTSLVAGVMGSGAAAALLALRAWRSV